jgi:plastocyanin
MDGDFFFVMGGILVLAAVVLAFFGIRNDERFPASRAVMVGGVAVFAAIVATTMAFAVVKSVDEQDKRNKELAKEEEQPAAPQENPGGQPQASAGGNQQAPATGETGTLNVASPADGSLVYQPDGLQAQPGNLTITYDNPSPVPHSIAVATANGNVIGEVQPFTQGKESVQLHDLKPGKYVFYCTVPGHREAGMQGDLTVGAGQQ